MLTSAEVSNLLGQYHHKIEFGDNANFLIMYGLNGVGKTKFLEIINATIKRNYQRLAATPFDNLILRSDSGAVLTVRRTEVPVATDKGGMRIEPSIVYSLVSAGGVDAVEWRTEEDPEADLRRRVAHDTQYEPLGDANDNWHDPYDGEIVPWEVLRNRFSPVFLDRPANRKFKSDTGIDPTIGEFLKSNQVHFIETQRLIADAALIARDSGRQRRHTRWIVDQFATDMRGRIERALADNSISSQRLDKSFPRRIIDQEVAQAMSEREIRELQQHQDHKREQLGAIGLTAMDESLPLPMRQLEDWQRAVLTTYLRDNEQKLSTFDDLLDKISLLEELVNARFLSKRISINALYGLKITNEVNQQEIPTNGLSTGEQHELVLLYNLLFHVRPNSVVMIDEPEISMHVSWQKKFLEDVSRIAELANFSFIVATHSPQIIGKWWSRTVEIGPKVAD